MRFYSRFVLCPFLSMRVNKKLLGIFTYVEFNGIRLKINQNFTEVEYYIEIGRLMHVTSPNNIEATFHHNVAYK